MRPMWIWALLVLLVIACGDKDRPKTLAPDGSAASNGLPAMGGAGGRSAGGSGGRATVGGRAADGGDTAEAGAAGTPSDPDGPLVRVTSPAEVLDPDDGELLFGTDVDVKCQVARAGADESQALDPTKVKIVMIDAIGKETAKAGISTGTLGEFSAKFAIGTLENGAISFRCSASDLAKPARVSVDEVSTFIDRGPKVTPLWPIANAAYPLEGAVRFEFTVEPLPLSDGDEGAALGEVTLTVDGVPMLALREDSTTKGLFSVAVNFADPTVFPMTPVGSVTVDIRATNRRAPMPAERVASYSIVIDALGPTIAIASPRTGAIVGDQVQLNFSVTDAASGVDPASVSVTLNKVEYLYGVNGEWTKVQNAYTFTFDSTKIADSGAQATVNVRAADLAGNAAKEETLLLYFDNEPPAVLLDVPNIRMVKAVGTNYFCSESFDPLGPAAANDGQTIVNAHTFRTLVWDRTNAAPGQGTVYHSQTNPASVRMYVQPDTSQALLIDTDRDGVCDELDLAGTTVVEMTALAPQGAPYYTTLNQEASPVTTLLTCDYRQETPKPTPLCENDHSDMAFVIRHTMAASPAEPAIYALDPQVGGLDCTGRTWEIYSVVAKEGWVCIAGRAEDKVLNHGISPPLRVCLNNATDDGTPAGTSTPCAGVQMPSCTDGCVPPSKDFPVDSILELK